MGFDSRERDGRRDVRATLAGMHGCKGGTSTQQLLLYVCMVRQKGRWHSTSDKIINVLVCYQYRKEEGGGEGGGGLREDVWGWRRPGAGETDAEMVESASWDWRSGGKDEGRGIMAQEFSSHHQATF